MKNVQWIGPLNIQNGYGQAGYNYLKALNKKGVNLTLANTDPKPPTDETFPDPILRKIFEGSRLGAGQDNVFIFHCDPNVLIDEKIQQLIRSNKAQGIRNISYTTFETDTIPVYWVRVLEQMDEIFTPSEFSKASFVKSGLNANKIKVIHHILPEPLNVDYEMGNPAWSKFVFGSVFDFVSKKGWMDLLVAFWQEFTPADNACLVLKIFPSRFGYNDNGYEYVSNNISALKEHVNPENAAPIFYVQEFYSEEQMEALFKSFDAFVLPTKGEGFGLPIAEAMKRSIPTIATDVGGHADFFDSSVGYPVKSERAIIDDIETCMNTPHYHDKYWRACDIADLRRQMREVYTNYEQAKEKAVKAKERMDKDYNEEVIVEQLMKAIDGDADKKTTFSTPQSFSSSKEPASQSTESKPKVAHTRRPVIQK